MLGNCSSGSDIIPDLILSETLTSIMLWRGGVEIRNAPNDTAAMLFFEFTAEAERRIFVLVAATDVMIVGRRFGTFVLACVARRRVDYSRASCPEVTWQRLARVVGDCAGGRGGRVVGSSALEPQRPREVVALLQRERAARGRRPGRRAVALVVALLLVAAAVHWVWRRQREQLLGELAIAKSGDLRRPRDRWSSLAIAERDTTRRSRKRWPSGASHWWRSVGWPLCSSAT